DGGRHGGRPVRRLGREISARRTIAGPAGHTGAGRGHPLRADAGAAARRRFFHGRARGRAMSRLLALLALLLAFAVPAQAERLVSQISNDNVEITSSFDGERMTFFGTITPDAGAEQKFVEGPFHAIVVVVGPTQNRVARQMSNV